jgi:hypothetical protein
VLRFIYDLPVNEVAEILGCSPGTRQRTHTRRQTNQTPGIVRMTAQLSKLLCSNVSCSGVSVRLPCWPRGSWPADVLGWRVDRRRDGSSY